MGSHKMTTSTAQSEVSAVKAMDQVIRRRVELVIDTRSFIGQFRAA